MYGRLCVCALWQNVRCGNWFVSALGTVCFAQSSPYLWAWSGPQSAKHCTIEREGGEGEREREREGEGEREREREGEREREREGEREGERESELRLKSIKDRKHWFLKLPTVTSAIRLCCI